METVAGRVLGMLGAFCAEHLPHLDAVVWEFFGSPVARDAVRQKVAQLFPEHEVDQFTELFLERIERWRADSRPIAAGSTER